MDSDRTWRNVCGGVCITAALLLAICCISGIFELLSSAPASAPQVGMSAAGWLAFLKAIGAAALACVFARAAMYIAPRQDGGAMKTMPTSECVLQSSSTSQALAYHAIFARKENGELSNGFRIGFVREGHKGYTPEPDRGLFHSFAEAQDEAERLNAQLGISKRRADRLISRWC